MTHPKRWALDEPMNTTWHGEGSCAGMAAEWDRIGEDEQVALCLACPVRQACLDEGLETHAVDVVRGGIRFPKYGFSRKDS